MSASDKKKLRKELNSAAMTERQKAEQKTQKKQKAVTLTFIICMVLVVSLVLVSVLTTPINRAIVNSTVAATVGDHQISATELNYFYVDAMNNVYNNYSDYGDYQDMYVYYLTGWNPATAVGDQTYDTETGETWADYFIEAAVENAKWTYAIYDKAMADDSFELTEEDQTSIDSVKSYMELYGTLTTSGTADGYLRAVYGSSASLESYMEYYTMSYIASEYATQYLESLEYTDADYREFEADKMAEYNSYSWLSYYVKASSYLTGGTTTTDEDGKESTTYSDDEKAASVDAAKADADILAGSDITDLESFNTAINALEINAESTTAKTATEYDSQIYDYVSYYAPNEDAAEWLTSDERVAGDVTVVEYSTEDTEGNKTINGYYVLCYVGSIDNSEVNIGTVRHLLVAFEEDEDGNVTEEAMAEALAEAEELLAEYESGKKTEESFTLLLKEHSDDVDSNGDANYDGLYENITPDSGYESSFAEWATADHEVGDVGIIESSYGYHIMYYVGAADLNYRDTMIKADIQNEDYTAWEDAILEDVTAELLTSKHVNTDFIMSSGS